MAEAAARAGDNIHHTSALAGFIIGTIIGAALIAGVAFATVSCGFIAGLVIGYMAGEIAKGIRSLSESIGNKCKSTTGKILPAGCAVNVLINGRPAARAVLSNVECAKDMPVALIAEGSSNVFINQNPAARKDDKIECGATISEGSDNVLIGGGRVQYLEVKDEIPGWVRTASDITFIVAGIAGGVAGAFKSMKLLTTLKNLKNAKCILQFGAGFATGVIASMLVDKGISSALGGLFGNPVDITTGQKILFDEQELDFVLSAPLPLYWQRYYSSELDRGMLGKGWRLDFEVSLTREGEEIIYCGRTGRKSYFPCLAVGEYSWVAESQLYLYCMPDGRHVIRTLSDIYTVFPAFADSNSVYPEHIEDRDNNYIRFHYDEKNPRRLTGISDSQNNTLLCHWHPTLARLLSVERIMESGGKEELVRYFYDERGNLSTVCNQAGTLTRRFRYDKHDLMTEHINAAGLRCGYRWQQFAEDKWCVAESYNSEGERASYVYDFTQGRARVTDERNLTAAWQFDSHQQVTYFEDFNQDTYRIEYNPQGMPTAFHLPGERTITLRHDNLNRIIEEIDPLGRTVRTNYWLSTLNVVRKEFPDGGIWQAGYDEKGHPLVTTDPAGNKTHYRWNKQGLPVEITDATGGKKTLVWNDRARLQQHTDCSGKSVYYSWNERGDLLSITNMLGEVTRFSYNGRHELEQIQYPDGTHEFFSYFPAGLLKHHTDTAGWRREWRYNRRGQPLHYIDRLNRKLHYFYDGKGNLERLLNANGGEYRFCYDVAGRLTEETRPDKTRRLFRYDAAGFPAELICQGTGHTQSQPCLRQTMYRFDKGGRLVARQTSMAEYFYKYDAADRLTELRREPTAPGKENEIDKSLLTFRWDKSGQLLEETSDGEAVEYQWDPLGNLTDLRLPDNNSLHWLSYGSGHISAVRFNQDVVTEFERDDLHREILRTQGALTQRRGYDARGRRIWQSALTEALSGADAVRPQQGKLWRTFLFDRAGELIQTEDAFRGMQHYRYDAESRLLEYEAPQPEKNREIFSYDDADNIYGLPDLDWETSHRGKPDAFRSNRLPFWRHTGFIYDAFGNLIQRTQGSLTQYFAYDDENRLLKAWGDGPRGRYKASYRYDALGRRTKKSVAFADTSKIASTCFRWQGLRLIQETGAEYTRTYVYDPNERYTPLARITRQGEKQQTDYFHTDLNGTPLEVTDSAGNIVWCGKYSAWGKLKPQVLLENETPGLPRQPLRYPGQYFDDETGLHYNTFRYYDPEPGRFTTQDPIGLAGGINLYKYAPNPLSWIDPLGLETITVYHYTDQRGFNGISGTGVIKASDPGARGKGAISGKPKGVYVTTMSPAELSASGARGQMGLTREKSTHFISFEIDDSQVKRIDRQDGVKRLYIEEDVQLRGSDNKLRGDVKTGRC